MQNSKMCSTVRNKNSPRYSNSYVFLTSTHYLVDDSYFLFTLQYVAYCSLG